MASAYMGPLKFYQGDDFRLPDVALAADVPVGTVKQWLAKNLVDSEQPILGGGGRGLRRKFAFGTMMQIAVGAEMASYFSLPLNECFQAAAVFSFTGAEGETIDATGAPSTVSRLPGLPFPGRTGTYLFMAPPTHGRARILTLEEAQKAFSSSLMTGPKFIGCLDLDAVFNAVCHAFGHSPDAVLDAAYSSLEKDI